MKGARGYLLDNLGLKLLSLVIAFVLWMIVFRGDQSVGQSLTVPLQLVPGPSLMLLGQSSRTVKLDVEGTPQALRNLAPADIVARIPIPEGRLGETGVEVTREHLNLPRDIRVTVITPPVVSAVIDRIRHKSVEIRPSITGEPAPGYRMGEVTAKPRTVEVEGAETEVRGLEAIPTEPVNVAGRKEGFLQTVPLAGTGRPTVLPTRNVLVEVRVNIVPLPPVLGPERPPGTAPPAGGKPAPKVSLNLPDTWSSRP